MKIRLVASCRPAGRGRAERALRHGLTLAVCPPRRTRAAPSTLASALRRSQHAREGVSERAESEQRVSSEQQASPDACPDRAESGSAPRSRRCCGCDAQESSVGASRCPATRQALVRASQRRWTSELRRIDALSTWGTAQSRARAPQRWQRAPRRGSGGATHHTSDTEASRRAAARQHTPALVRVAGQVRLAREAGAMVARAARARAGQRGEARRLGTRLACGSAVGVVAGAVCCVAGGSRLRGSSLCVCPA